MLPGTASAFNSSHPLAAGCTQAAIAIAGSAFIGLNGTNSGKATTNAGAPANKVLPNMGTCVAITGAADQTNFPNQPTANITSGSFATIVQTTTTASNIYFAAIGTTNAALFGSASAGPTLFVGGTGNSNVNASIVISTNTPYFLLASFNASASNFVVRRLDTGVIQTAAIGSGLGVAIAQSGTYGFGTWGGHGISTVYTAASAVWANKYYDLNTLLLAAKDPWSLWYPQ
jgi:hypothetical protein